MGSGIVIGPYFSKTTLMDYLDYLQLIDSQTVPALRLLPRYRNAQYAISSSMVGIGRCSLSQARRGICHVDQRFENRVIAMNRAFECPARSRDLTPLDFFLWCCLKSNVSLTQPENLAERQQRIREEMTVLRQDRAMISGAVFDMFERAQVCTQRSGAHVKD